MIKNQANIYQFVLRDMIGQGVTGLSPTVRIRKDTGSFTATTNTPTEVGYGLYEVALTATECNCDIMAIEVSLPDGQFPAILANEYLTSSGGATPQQIWEYTGGRTVTNTIPTAQNIWEYSSRTLTASALTAQQVWEYSGGRTLTASPTDISGLATSQDVANIATTAGAIKAKTDNLPQNPAATGDAMTLTSAYDAAKTASQFDVSQDAVLVSIYSANAIRDGLSTFNPSTDTVTLNSTQAGTFGTATAQTSILALLETLYSGLYHWEVNGTELTIYDADGLAISAYTLTKDAIGNIIAVTPEE